MEKKNEIQGFARNMGEASYLAWRFCPSGDANCFALENERVKGEALDIIKLNARHFRFNQPPATSEINSIHKSSQKNMAETRREMN